ncbi:MAG: peptidoglycan DD-metalloendopeptidase family protein [Saccharofermentans sp.]|nr:peptidoglycan DD-metalloendopeptidase family protein [Saccharofermentans sp.]
MKDFINKHIRHITSVLVALVITGMFSSAALVLRKPVVVCASDNLIQTIEIFRRDTEDELEQRRRERDNTSAQAAAAAAMVASLSGEQSRLTGELEELNALSEEQRAQYEIIASQLAAALLARAEALDVYIQAQDNLAATELMFQERLAVMFEYQNKSALEVLLESDSIAGFFTNMEIISLIAEADDQAVNQMTVALDDARAQEEYALQQADEMQAIADEKQAQLDELEARIGVTTAALDDVACELDSWTAQEMSLEAIAASLDQQILDLQNRYAAEQAAAATSTTTIATETETNPDATSTPTPTPAPTQTSSSASGVSLSWPTWCHTITSSFGYRVHPIYGDRRFHSGVDIGAGFGDTIMAAGSGTVIYVNYPYPNSNYGGSGYGNYFIIDHGNGVTTLYAHCQSISVSNGQSVSAGQAVGTVGSTGGSTGAHLHFEVRVNGDRVDPLGCI